LDKDLTVILAAAASQDVLTEWKDRGQRMASRQPHELFRAPLEEGTVADQNRTNGPLRKSCKGRLDRYRSWC
jgi:hypothetical protein